MSKPKLRDFLKTTAETLDEYLDDIRRAKMKSLTDRNQKEAARLAGLELAARNCVIMATCMAAQLDDKP